MKDKEVKTCALSPLLLVSLPPIIKGWKSPKKFLLGVRRPWEPDPWEFDDNLEDDSLFIQGSQAVEQVEETSTDVEKLLLDKSAM